MMVGACSPQQDDPGSQTTLAQAPSQVRSGGEPLPDLHLGLMRDVVDRWEMPLDVPGFSLRVDASRGAGDTIVRLNWLCCYRESPDSFIDVKASTQMDLPVGYPFASMAFLPDGRLLIGGVELGSQWPIFDIWTFEPPDVDLGEGGAGPFEMKVSPAPGKKTVRAHGDDQVYGCAQSLLVAPDAADDAVWMLTFPRYELRRLDLSTGRSTLMLKPDEDDNSSERWDTERETWHHGFHWGRHKVHGDIYLLTIERCDIAPSPGVVTGTVLIDRNLDGELDEARLCRSEGPWFASLFDPEQWVK